MLIAVRRENTPGEHRVAAIPSTVEAYVAMGCDVVVEPGAGIAAGFPDSQFEAAGATVSGDIANADIMLIVGPPGPDLLTGLRDGMVVAGFLDPLGNPALIGTMAERNITALAVETIPRTTLAQSMDALSSQATAAGYAAVLLAATTTPRFFPMLVTAAGTVPPARVLILGVGVAGLQAIATAKRLGASVFAYDIRPETKEQVESLGARFVEAVTTSQDAGGYARAVDEDVAQQQQEALAAQVADSDIIITTAQVPGRKAPRLITADVVASMKAGSVIVDLAAASGGNVEGSQPDETVVVGGVTILGPSNLAAGVAADASRMYARNLQTLLQHIIEESEGGPQIAIDLADEITAGATVTHDGSVVNGAVRSALGLEETL
ncbi:MAG: NAD(P) transhydrogenase subunit alpha [Acidimicrobiia bacterium]|nr:NAD(P) transhydrogenase subunit alpha [Acidimicrobiia bacterium]